MEMVINSQLVKNLAHAVGFDACGVACVEPLDEMGLTEWLESGCHADMHFMTEHIAMRTDPSLLIAGAHSVISVLLGYKPSRLIGGKAKIAQYAYGDDYHVVLKKMLFLLIEKIRELAPEFEAKPCVDTVPVSDKLWAARAGLGWIGRNTLLVNPVLGSYCFVGELVTTATFDHYDTPLPNGCDNCRRCVDACPNHALRTTTAGNSPDKSPRYTLDARQCASYHTIENRSESLPDEIRLSGYAFGCDCCQLMCPYNQEAIVRYQLSQERGAALESLPDATETEFKKFVRHSALSRIKYTQWIRNLSAHHG